MTGNFLSDSFSYLLPSHASFFLINNPFPLSTLYTLTLQVRYILLCLLLSSCKFIHPKMSIYKGTECCQAPWRNGPTNTYSIKWYVQLTKGLLITENLSPSRLKYQRAPECTAKTAPRNLIQWRWEVVCDTTGVVSDSACQRPSNRQHYISATSSVLSQLSLALLNGKALVSQH